MTSNLDPAAEGAGHSWMNRRIFWMNGKQYQKARTSAAQEVPQARS
jgi:hypothetical protein